MKPSFKVVVSDERYIVEDDNSLKQLVTSITSLNAGYNTNGHSHKGQEEVYIFQEGKGKMVLDDKKIDVKEGDIVLIADGVFHKVFNNSNSLLKFLCVFNGVRYT